MTTSTILVWKGYKQTLSIDDLDPLPKKLSTEDCDARVTVYWNEYMQREKKPNLILARCLIKAFRWNIVTFTACRTFAAGKLRKPNSYGCIELVNVIGLQLQPILLFATLRFVKSYEDGTPQP